MVHDVTVCPLCGSTKRKMLWEVSPYRDLGGKKFLLYRCAECTVRYTSPRPTDDELVLLYDEVFYWNAEGSRRLTDWFYNVFFYARRWRIERYVKPGKLLDVGCGTGRFVTYMADHGWDTVGYDFSPTAKKLAEVRENEHVKIIHGNLTDQNLPSNSFDVITLWQVLEHVAEPISFLHELRRLLKPGGLIVIAVPNVDSLQAKITGPNWLGLDMPRHLTHYGPRPLRRALTTTGFLLRREDHYTMQYSLFAIFHSLTDPLFTRRDFFSDWAKRCLPADMPKAEIRRNLIRLLLASPVVIIVSVLDVLISPSLKRGGYMDVYAIKTDNPASGTR